jgi:TrmH family RNA methyltransferase
MIVSPAVFVLVGTRSSGNLGAVCRIAKAFGFPEVALVAPRVAPHDADARRLAHGAEDVLETVRTFATLREAVAGCARSIATTARARDWSRRVVGPAELAGALGSAAGPLAVVFGPEDQGLCNDDLAACDVVFSIPLPPGAGATLSLPAAAAITAWELANALGWSAARPAAEGERSERGSRPLDAEALSRLLDRIDDALREIGFRPRPDAVRFRGSLRDFLARAAPTRADELVLRHVLAQVGKWSRRVAGERGR